MAYAPPAASAGILGSITTLLGSATPLNKPHGCNFIATLQGGPLYFDSKLWIDTDGSTFHRPKKAVVKLTSLLNADGTGLDANVVPYIALPPKLAAQTGINLGDFAVVIRGVRVVPAIYADTGPDNIIGEASVAVHRALGNDPIDSKGAFLDNGLDAVEHILTIVFPGSGNGKPRTADEISSIGSLSFLILTKAALLQSAGAVVNKVRGAVSRF